MKTLDEGLAQIYASAGGAASLPGSPPDKARELLGKYIEEIERFNPAYKLVKVQNREELVIRHILDSLAPLRYIAPLLRSSPDALPPSLADLGSGAGLPGIPLAVCLPETRVTLIERMGRRAGFLRNAAAALGLSNVLVDEVEAERAAPGRFGVLVFRAFHPLEPGRLKNLFRLLAPGGYLAAYKGRKDKVEAELAAAGIAPGPAVEIIPLETPFLKEERHLALIRSGLP
jgi:16S rRNA (guanine527-N7)-methyltransferase